MALRRMGIPNKIVSVIKSTYNGAKCRVLHNGTHSAPFVVGSGVRQGCILSHVLFLLVIGDIIQASIAKHHLGVQISVLFFITANYFHYASIDFGCIIACYFKSEHKLTNPRVNMCVNLSFNKASIIVLSSIFHYKSYNAAFMKLRK